MKVAVATSLYEAGLPYLDAWLDGVSTASNASPDVDVHVCVALDGLSDIHGVEDRLKRSFRPSFQCAHEGSTIAEVRRLMLELASNSACDIAVFCDIDDVLADRAFEIHLHALEDHDISVGDLQPVRADGMPIGSPMFGAHLPASITLTDLQERNWCGFSNTAVTQKALGLIPAAIPETAAVDWFVFLALLEAGCTACGTHEVVAFYRQHQQNMLGAGKSASIEDASRRLQILAAHYRARGEIEAADLALALSADVERLRLLRTDVTNECPAWHAETSLWCAKYREELTA